MILIKKFKKFIISGALILLLAMTVEASQVVRVYVNGLRVNGDAILYNDKTYIPLRAVGEAMGAEVSWDDASKSAYVDFSEDDAIAKVVETASPSVVTIVGNYDGNTASVQYNNPTMHGSGVIYKSSGYIVTNAHVIKDIKNLTVVLNDGTSIPGRVLYSDELADLAVVKIEKLGLTPITFAPKEAIVSGKTSIAIGTPISLSMRNSVTKGIVSGVGVALPDSHYKLLQTDTTINPGNSGGPLLNVKGELIGINSSKYASVEIDNIGFAIPVDTVQHVISHFEQYGKVLRPNLQVKFEESWEAKIGLPTRKGITVKSSQSEGLLESDIIYAVGGIEVHSIADWNEAIKSTYNGQILNVRIERNGVTQEIQITA